MKKLFAICIWSLSNLFCFSQDDSLTVYHYSDLKKYNPDTIYALSFEKMKLEKIPKDLEHFTKLVYLDVSKNKLTDLPDFIGNFSKIEVLNISKNKLETFPNEICRLSKLKKLIANRNLFDKIPECIGFCPDLEIIDLWSTPIMTFPVAFQNLKNLKELDLQGIKYNPKFQKDFQSQIPWVKIKFDPPCDCMN